MMPQGAGIIFITYHTPHLVNEEEVKLVPKCRARGLSYTSQLSTPYAAPTLLFLILDSSPSPKFVNWCQGHYQVLSCVEQRTTTP